MTHSAISHSAISNVADDGFNLMPFINIDALAKGAQSFHTAEPFSHCVIDNFFMPELAQALEAEFPDYNATEWHEYNNPIEVKKTCNNWNVFKPLTYRAFAFFNSPAFVQQLSSLLAIAPLYADDGLNGGGWHIHKAGGKLNTHLDYSIHPKLGLQRRLNLIIYMSQEWQTEWGGALGFWSHDAQRQQPAELVKEIAPVFNRAVLFDTTQNSWHGLPKPLTCPAHQFRKSLAVYYLTTPPENTDPRGKALFAPDDNQKNDGGVLELIRQRAGTNTASDVYIKK